MCAVFRSFYDERWDDDSFDATNNANNADFFCRITVTHNIDNKKENHDEVMNALGDINLTHSVSSIRVIVEVIKTSYFIFIFSRFYLFYK